MADERLAGNDVVEYVTRERPRYSTRAAQQKNIGLAINPSIQMNLL